MAAEEVAGWFHVSLGAAEKCCERHQSVASPTLKGRPPSGLRFRSSECECVLAGTQGQEDNHNPAIIYSQVQIKMPSQRSFSSHLNLGAASASATATTATEWTAKTQCQGRRRSNTLAPLSPEIKTRTTPRELALLRPQQPQVAVGTNRWTLSHLLLSCPAFQGLRFSNFSVPARLPQLLGVVVAARAAVDEAAAGRAATTAAAAAFSSV